MRLNYTIIAICLLFCFSFTYGQNESIGIYKKIPEEEFSITSSGLKYYFITREKGIKPTPGDHVSLHFTGMLANDTIFDTSYARDVPLEVTLGIGQLIPGWEEGLQLIPEGSKAILIVPPEFGYGEFKHRNIPPNSVLVFYIELLKVYPDELIAFYDIKDKEEKTTTSGIRYYIIEEGEGDKPVDGSVVQMNYTGYLENGKIFETSLKNPKPFKFLLGSEGLLKSLEEGVKLMSPGAKYKFFISSELAFGDKSKGPNIPENSNLIFDVELLEVQPEIHPKPFNTKGKKKIKSKTGLKYYIIKEGEGPAAEKDKIVTVHYTGYFKNGDIFESSVKRDEPIQFPLGNDFVIKAWEEGLKGMKPGGKKRLIVPYKLGYGKEGNPPAIPPKTDLIFDIELLEVK